MEQVEERHQQVSPTVSSPSYESTEQVNQLFKSGNLKGLPTDITIAGVHYHFKDSITHPIPDMLNKNLKAFVVYSVSREKEKSEIQPEKRHNVEFEQAREQGLVDEWLVLIWAITPSLVIAPARAVNGFCRVFR